jgi:hypothetical protein
MTSAITTNIVTIAYSAFSAFIPEGDDRMDVSVDFRDVSSGHPGGDLNAILVEALIFADWLNYTNGGVDLHMSINGVPADDQLGNFMGNEG